MISEGLLAQIFKIDCTQSGRRGTGTFHCPFNVNRVSTIIFTPQGFEYAEAFSVAYLQTLQQQGNAVVLAKATSVENRTAADNVITETGSNIKTTAGKSPREFGFTFKNGLYFDMAMRTLAGFGNYDVTYLDDKLSIICTSTEDAVKGFTCGQVDVEPYLGGNGADDAKSILWLQELYRPEFDKDATWVIGANHNIRLASLDGVNDAIVTIEQAPANGDTTIVFSVKTKADRKLITGFTSLLVADLEFTKDTGTGATVIAFTGAPTYSASTGLFTGTLAAPLAEDDVVTLRLNDATFTTGIMKKGNRLFASNTDSATVVA